MSKYFTDWELNLINMKQEYLLLHNKADCKLELLPATQENSKLILLTL
jgi:hypothetical protein